MKHSMIFWVLIVCVSLSGNQILWGQVLDFKMRQGLPHPWQSTAYPESQQVRVTETGAWRARLSGDLMTKCDGPCFEVKPPAGTGPATVTVSFLGRGGELLKPGKYSAEISIGSQSWTPQLTVLPRFPYLPFVYSSGYPAGCHQSIPQLPFADTCQITNEQPAVNMPELRTAGSSWNDAQFGGKVTRLTGPGFNVSYSSMRALSANSVYILTSDIEGFLQIWDRQSGAKVGAKFSGASIGQTVWDPQDDDRLWIMQGSQILTRTVRTSQVTVAADYKAASGDRPALLKLDNGGTSDNTDDNWWVFIEASQKLVCAVNLNGLSRTTQEDQLFCTSYSPQGLRFIDFPQVTQVDSESGKRYVVLLADPVAQVYSVNTATKKLDYEFATPPEIKTPHSDVGQDSKGRQVLFWTWVDVYGDKPYAATSYLNRGAKMARPVEEGGGLRILYPISDGRERSDTHFGCNWNGYCVLGTYGDPVPGGIPVWQIETVQPGTPCVVRLSSTHPFVTGGSVAVGGLGDLGNVNGVSKIRAIDSRTIALEGRSCQGVYAGKTGHLAEARQYSNPAPNRDELVVIRLDGEIRRTAIHRTKIFADQGDISGYWATPRPSISRDGRYIVYSSNLGLPETNSVFWAEVNLKGEIRQAKIVPRDVTAALSWTGPDEVVILVSKDPDLVDWVFSYEHFQGDPTEHIIDGLSPETVYYVHLVGRESFFSFSFQTSSASPGIGPEPGLQESHSRWMEGANFAW